MPACPGCLHREAHHRGGRCAVLKSDNTPCDCTRPVSVATARLFEIAGMAEAGGFEAVIYDGTVIVIAESVPAPPTFTTYASDGTVRALHVTREHAFAAYEKANGDALVIDDSDDRMACSRDTDLGCGCDRCNPVDGQAPVTRPWPSPDVLAARFSDLLREALTPSQMSRVRAANRDPRERVHDGSRRPRRWAGREESAGGVRARSR